MATVTGRERLYLTIIALLLAGCGATGSGNSAGVVAVVPTDGPYAVVAIGASNTEGFGRGRTAGGVPRDQAYPAQLERLLASQGCRVRVLNAGRAGDTTDDMLARLPSVMGSDTRVVILQPGGNDERRGSAGGTEANVAALQRAVRQRGAQPIILDGLETIAGSDRLADGQHFSAEGHARFAAYLAPKVREAGACTA